MKKLVLFCSMAVLLMAACKKEEPIDEDPTDVIEYPASAVVIRNAVADIDGNKYDAVQIGDQVWMARNLRTTRFTDGSAVPEGTDVSYDTPCRYTPDNSNPINGYLYNWQAVMYGEPSSETDPSGVQGICPDGWHLPSDAEWLQLTEYLSSHSEYVCSETEGNVAKSLALSRYWSGCGDACTIGNNPEDNNATGFSAVPVGYYPGSYTNYGYNANFWSSTEVDSTSALGVNLFVADPLVRRLECDKVGGFSVRCLRN